MKKISTFLAMLVLAATATTAAAQRDNPLYFSVKAGVMDPDIGGFDNAVNLGVTVGYHFSRDRAQTLSVEGEFTTTMFDGSVTGGGDWDADTLGLFGVYRSPGNIYFKGRAGYLTQDIKQAGGASTQIPNADDSGFSYGLGLGWRVDTGSTFELEYTAVSDELEFMSIGYIRRF